MDAKQWWRVVVVGLLPVREEARVGSKKQKPIQTRSHEKGINYKERWERWIPTSGSIANPRMS